MKNLSTLIIMAIISISTCFSQTVRKEIYKSPQDRTVSIESITNVISDKYHIDVTLKDLNYKPLYRFFHIKFDTYSDASRFFNNILNEWNSHSGKFTYKIDEYIISPDLYSREEQIYLFEARNSSSSHTIITKEELKRIIRQINWYIEREKQIKRIGRDARLK